MRLFGSTFDKIEALSTVIAIIVLVSLLAVFTIQFVSQYILYKKVVDNKLEDETIAKQIVKENKRYFLESETIVNSTVLSQKEKKEMIVPFRDYIENKKIRQKRCSIAGKAAFSLFFIVFAVFAVFGVVSKANGDVMKLGDTSALIIKTASMSTKNEANTYLETNNLDNQIEVFSLIGITSSESYEVYDILAFKNEKDNNIIVHRLVRIDVEDGKLLYTLRGDANDASAAYETRISGDLIIGKYNGFSSFFIGIILNYLTSFIGIIAVIFALALITYYEVLGDRSEKLIAKRKEIIYTIIDSDIYYSLTNAKTINYCFVLEKDKHGNVLKGDSK